MDKELFSDGISRISVIGGVVRADLITLSPPEADPGGQPRPVLTTRLVMGIEAFVRSAEKMQEAVQAILKMQQQAAKAATRTHAQPVSSPQPIPDRQGEHFSAGDRSELGASDPTQPFP